MPETECAVPASLLEDLETLPKQVVKAYKEAGKGLRHFKPAPQDWSLREILWHLADVEMGYGWRLRMILAHDHAQIVPFDQDLFAQRLRYDALKPKTALEVYRALRAATLGIAKGLTAEQLRRTAIHPEQGEITALWILERLAGHDRTHVEQMGRRAEEWAAKKASA